MGINEDDADGMQELFSHATKQAPVGKAQTPSMLARMWLRETLCKTNYNRIGVWWDRVADQILRRNVGAYVPIDGCSQGSSEEESA